jgi:hypothetical protein
MKASPDVYVSRQVTMPQPNSHAPNSSPDAAGAAEPYGFPGHAPAPLAVTAQHRAGILTQRHEDAKTPRDFRGTDFSRLAVTNPQTSHCALRLCAFASSRLRVELLCKAWVPNFLRSPDEVVLTDPGYGDKQDKPGYSGLFRDKRSRQNFRPLIGANGMARRGFIHSKTRVNTLKYAYARLNSLAGKIFLTRHS